MENLFTIPTLISPQCPSKLVPALSKLVERQLLLSYSSVLRSAAIIRYLGPYKGLLSDNTILRMHELISLVEEHGGISRMGSGARTEPDPSAYGGGSAEGEKWAERPYVRRRDETEVVRGVTFFNTISLEPTILEIPLRGRISKTSEEIATRVVRVGMKCVPYQLNGVSDILSAMEEAKNRNYAKTYFMQKFPSFISRSKFSAKDFLIKSPPYKELTNPKKVAQMMAKTQAQWTFLVILTADDLEGRDPRELTYIYNDLVKGGWGEMIVIDDTKDVISFCTKAGNYCSQIHIDYLREVLNLDNVIDADLFKKASGGSSVFRNRVPMKKVFESCTTCRNKK